MTTEFSRLSQSMIEESGAAPSMDVRIDFKRLLFVRLPLMLLVAAAVGVPATVMAWFLTPLEYEAAATLEFQAARPRIMDTGSQDRQGISYEMYVNTQMALMAGDNILNNVLQDPSIRVLPVLARESDPVEYLKRKIQVVRVGRNSELVRISFRSVSRDDAKAIVKRLVEQYLEYAMRVEATSGGQRMEALLKARDSYQQEMERQLQEKARLATEQEVPSASMAALDTAGMNIQREALVRSEETLIAFQGQAAKAQEKMEQLKALEDARAKTPGGSIYEFGIEEAVRNDSKVISAREQYLRKDSEVAGLETQLTPESNRLKAVKADRDALKRQMTEAENASRKEAISTLMAQVEKELSSVNKDVEDQKTRVEAIRTRIGELEKAYKERSTKAVSAQAGLDEINMRIEESQSHLGEVRAEIGALSIESQAAARVQVAAQADVPNTPDYGRRLKFVFLAIMASLALGAGTGVLRELSEKRVQSAQDLSVLTRLPVLAAIPHAKEDRLIESVRAHLVTSEFPYSPMADAYRRILARIVYPPDSAVEINSLLVVSPTRGDGKTSVACNLAIMLARANRRVLLIDTCGWDPAIEACFGLSRAAGLSEILYQDVEPLALTRPTELVNLEILGPGLHGKELSGKLASRAMMSLLEHVEHEFDHVIIDSMAALLMSDAKLIAPVVDGVLLVVGTEVASRGMVRRCLAELEQVNADLLGVVLNGVRPTRGGYMRRNMAMYYRYSDTAPGAVLDADTDLPEIRLADEEMGEEEAEPIILLSSEEEESGVSAKDGTNDRST